MALNPIVPRLRVINKSNDVAKVDLRVAPGDQLEVSAEVAAQLGSEFTVADAKPEPVKAPAKAPAKKAAKKASA